MGKGLTIFSLFVLSTCVFGIEMSVQAEQNLQMLQMSTGFVVDDVFTMLSSFESDINHQITDMDEAVRVETEYLKEVIKSYETKKVDKRYECSKKLDDSDALDKEAQKISDFINWILKRVSDNQAKIDNYHYQSCTLTLNFVEYLRNAQNTLTFIKFIREALKNYSFTQMSALSAVLLRYKEHDELLNQTELLQTMLVELKSAIKYVDPAEYNAGESLNAYKSRTSDQIGTRHVDNTKGDMQGEHFSGARTQGLESVKEELFSILDSLEKMIHNTMNDKINGQIALSEATADFIIFLEREIDQLQRELIVQQELQRQMNDRQTQAKQLVDQCEEEFSDIQTNIDEAVTAHDRYIENRSQYKLVLQNQLSQLQAIIQIYSDKVSITSESLKKRYDDLIDNKKVDYSSETDDRSLTSQYDNLQNPQDLELKVASEVQSSDLDLADEESPNEVPELP